jgi:uncharacterized protein
LQLLDGRLIYSATDLNNFLECEHLVELERLVALGERERPAKSAQAELIAGKGIEHEARHLQRLQTHYDDVVTIDAGAENTRENLEAAAAATIAAMQAGARIIYQGVFFDGTWLGKSDFLLRVEQPSAKWPWSYEVADTKLALHTKTYFIVQLCFYSEQLAAIQGTPPTHMHVILGDGREERHRLEHYQAYYQRLKERFEAGVTQDTYPLKVKHCDVCAWDSVCKQRREDDDHLSLVARIRRDQVKKLQDAKITTLAALAAAGAQQRPAGMDESTFVTLHRQARLQHRQRAAFTSNGAGGPKYFYELLDPKEQYRGFGLLPRPARGDIFFDMEGDPLYLPGRGLEYLFGVYAPEDAESLRSFWAHTPLEEKRAFEAFIDYLTERRKRFPEMHVYHYAPYEKVALRRLMGLHSTREAEVDDLLRGEVFVDLYAVVRQAIAISQSSYSIKKLEAFYEMKRETETKFGGDSIVMYETWLQNPQRQDILDDIERYNQDDCRSTWMLREWLLQLREESIAAHGAIQWYEKESTRPPCHSEPLEGCKTCAKRLKETLARTEREQLCDALLRGLEDVDAFTILDHPEEERIRWMLAHLMQYHLREQKPVWWAFYDRCESGDNLISDSEALAGLQLCEEIEPFKLKGSDRNLVYTYSFPDQQYKLKPGIVFDPATRKAAGELIAIDSETNRLQLKRSGAVHAGPPLVALIPGGPIATDAQDASLERVARAPSALIQAFLLRNHPRLRGFDPGDRIQPQSVSAESLTRLVEAMDSTYLFIQGPPGSGKSTKAAWVISELLRGGKRIGVLSNSHAAIHNLLHKVEETALAHAVPFRGLQKYGDEDSRFASRLPHAMIDSTGDNDAFLTDDWQLAAGTAWLFAREQMAGKLDYLFIDEAGQIALADTIAVSPAAKNIVLLGDPLQLAQVSQGTHPAGIGCSALEHLLGDDATIAPGRGVFLDESYRMHPELCDFISQSVYEGRLRSAPQTRLQQVEASGLLSGSGLRFIGIDHRDNAQESSEEAARIADEIEKLLLATWTDSKGNTRLLTAEDILVVTPYNAQRRCILREFKKRNIAVRAGTVDKFQGQEAAVVFFSMATSSSEELPRNIEFLFSRNRFNVAISRARCLAVLVCSPRLLDLRCSTIEQMALTNLLCSFVAKAAHGSVPEQPVAQLALF